MRTWLSWSSGKDSAWSLHALRREGVDVVALLTTVNEEYERVAMHAVRRALLRAQAGAAGLPLIEVPIPSPCTNEQYEAAMGAAMARAKAEGIDAIAFGALFLELSDTPETLDYDRLARFTAGLAGAVVELAE